MRSLLIASLLVASAAHAGAPTPRLLTVALLGQNAPTGGATATDDEDEEEDAPAAAPADAPKADEAKPGEAATKPAEGAVTPTPAPAGEAQKLVSGAPLYNPNVAVHIVEKKQFSDKGRRELVLFPAAVQANGKFTQHVGTALSFVWHLHENFGFQLTPQYNWVAQESAFNGELITKVREQPQAATSLLLVWGVQGGVEVTPIYGKVALFDDTLAHFSVVLNGGAGIGSTRLVIKPSNQSGPATYGETGNKFVGALGGGFRLLLGERFAMRLELRDLVYTARVDTVNGCNEPDLTLMRNTVSGGGKPSAVQDKVSPSCRVATFEGIQPGTEDTTNRQLSDDLPLAIALVKDQSSDVLNNVGVYLGFSFLF